MIAPVLISAGTLASSFYRTYPGASPAHGADEALDAALEDFSRRGRAAWPELAVDAAALAAFLGERAPSDVVPIAWLGQLRADDMVLACACTGGVPQAIRAFDVAFLAKVSVYLRALRPTPDVVAETTQQLREKLFVGTGGAPPKIRQYDGRGSLDGWVRIGAVRTALNLLATERAAAPRPEVAEELARALAPRSNPELELIRAGHEDAFLTALREAIASLSRRDRGLLRSTYVERLTPARIGAMYGVHRTTVMRWTEAAQEDVLARTRSRLMERLSPSECDGVLGLLENGIDASLSTLLRTPS